MPYPDLPNLPLPFTLPAHNVRHQHLVVPYAASLDSSCQHLLQNLQLPNLAQLLQQLTPADADEGTADTPIPPHERTVARAWGLNPATPPWAAVTHNGAPQQWCAWMTLCHWSTGTDQVRMDDPAALPVTMAQAQALHAILQPWLAEDGLTMDIVQPHRWLVRGALLEGLATASLDRVVLNDITPWLPPVSAARQLHRLHSEVQMLLYNHPFNTERTAQGLPSINAFWFHGAGLLSDVDKQTFQRQQAQTHLQVADGLRQAALRHDWAAWQQAWLATDAGAVAQLLQHVQAGGSATLTLCGERHARSFTTASRSMLQKIKRMLQPQRFADFHQAL